jgi:uncharacterized protein with HEPN domain
VRSDRILLQDILESIAEVVENTPKSETDFDANKFVRSHLLRHIQIIGEASWSRVYITAREHVPVLKTQIEAILVSLSHDANP